MKINGIKDILANSTINGSAIPKQVNIVFKKLNTAKINGINFNNTIAILYKSLLTNFSSIGQCIRTFS